MDAGLLEETKSVLKSLIISCPHGMTIDRLNRDYREMEGRAIPYSALGFGKLEAFLRSLSDTLVVTGSGFNATVTAIVSEKTAHIDKMVTKQKSSTRKRTRLKPDYPERNGGDREYQSRQPLIMQINKQPTNQYQLQQHQWGPHTIAPLQKPTIQPIPSPQTIVQQKDFVQNVLRQQQQVQHNLHQSLYTSQGYMPNYFGLNTNSSAAMNCYGNYINHPLLSQAPNKLDWPTFQYSMQTRLQPMGYQQQHQPTVPLLNRLSQMNLNVPRFEAQQKSQADSSHISRQQNPNIKLESPLQFSVTSHQHSANQNNESNRNSLAIENGTCNGEVSKSAELVGFKKDLKSNSVETCLNSKNSSDKISSSISSMSRATNSCNEQKYAALESQGASSKQPTPNGDVLSKLSDEYLMELEQSLAAIDLGTNTKGGKLKFCRKNDAEAVPELQKNDIVFQLDYPLDTVKYGEFIPDAELPDNIIDANWFGVFITEIHNPYKFWFHFYKEDHELDKLMQHIENLYTRLGPSELHLHKSCLKPGQLCCALYMGMWHRAQILDTLDNGKVKVFFVDYGTVSPVDFQEVKYLLSEFSSLPCQAHRASLAHVKPVKHRWSRDATYAFLDLVTDLFLYAKVTEVDNKENVITMILTDTNKKVDFSINEALIRKGHARLSTSVDSNSTGTQHKTTNDARRKHFQEQYPTFAMLESGEYPSFHEISILLSKGIDFEGLQDGNIIPDVDGGHTIEDIARKLTDQNSSICRDNDQIETDSHHKQVLTNSSDYDHSSLSSMSENVNPFFTHSTNGTETKPTTHVPNGFETTRKSASQLNSNTYAPNPFLSDSDYEQDEIKSIPNGHHPVYPNAVHNGVQPQQPQQQSWQEPQPHFNQMFPQAQQNGYIPPVANYASYSDVYSTKNVMLHSAYSQHATKQMIPTSNCVRPPPGFENFQPKTRNPFQ